MSIVYHSASIMQNGMIHIWMSFKLNGVTGWRYRCAMALGRLDLENCCGILDRQKLHGMLLLKIYKHQASEGRWQRNFGILKRNFRLRNMKNRCANCVWTTSYYRMKSIRSCSGISKIHQQYCIKKEHIYLTKTMHWSQLLGQEELPIMVKK